MASTEAIVAVYVSLIRKGYKTLEEVPPELRPAVEKALDSAE